MPRDRSGPSTPGPGDRLVVAGAVVFLVGLVMLLVDVVPFFFGAQNRPLAVNLLALLLPVGLGIALLGLLLAARDRRRRARELDREH